MLTSCYVCLLCWLFLFTLLFCLSSSYLGFIRAHMTPLMEYSFWFYEGMSTGDKGVLIFSIHDTNQVRNQRSTWIIEAWTTHIEFGFGKRLCRQLPYR